MAGELSTLTLRPRREFFMLRMESTTDARMGVMLITFSGSARTVAAEDLDRVVNRILAQSPSFVIMDLTRLDVISSLTIGCILSIRRATLDELGKPAIIVTSPMVRKTLCVARIDELMELHESIESALAPVRSLNEFVPR